MSIIHSFITQSYTLFEFKGSEVKGVFSLSCLFWGGTLLFFFLMLIVSQIQGFDVGIISIFLAKSTLLAVVNMVILLLHCYSIVFTGDALLLDTT